MEPLDLSDGGRRTWLSNADLAKLARERGAGGRAGAVADRRAGHHGGGGPDRQPSRTVSLAGPIVLAAEILAASTSPSGSKSTRSCSSTPTPANCCAYQHRTAEAGKGIADAMNRKIKGAKIQGLWHVDGTKPRFP
ncbi:hypothetical protein GCM10011574_55860 [Microbispora bryophytorum]|uniref:Uncharacterized protein n=1 Tax=Microbispora bryophytorum TaxID=1460882 RepID=A0A8H9H3W0_9ACTN|nr:hypothetical protein GCM10011574_55860 [Microbispora bryophytorum]